VYDIDNPQAAPSGTLADYMKENNLPVQMPVEDAKDWFYAVRDTLKKKERRYAPDEGTYENSKTAYAETLHTTPGEPVW
jgi:hypothetical protein